MQSHQISLAEEQQPNGKESTFFAGHWWQRSGDSGLKFAAHVL